MYKEAFIKLEKSFRPRQNFKHSEVVDNLTKVVEKADKELSDLSIRYNEVMQNNFELTCQNTDLLNELKEKKKETNIYLYSLVVLLPFSFLLGKYIL